MILPSDAVKQILQGRRTMIRIPAVRDCPTIGRVYPIKSREHKATGQITILQAHEERLGALSLREAQREGFHTTLEARLAWITFYGSYHEDKRVWVLSFAVGDLTDKARLLRAGAPIERVCQARWKRPDGTTVKCERSFGKEFPDEPDRCSAGHEKPLGEDSDHGYTSSSVDALSREQEGLTEAQLRPFVDAAKERNALICRQALDVLSSVKDQRLAKSTHRRLKTIEHHAERLERELTEIA